MSSSAAAAAAAGGGGGGGGGGEEEATNGKDAPECPVCLDPYEPTATVPRVLPCGHTACERCIAQLPAHPAHPLAVRCPACNQLVRLPSPLPLGSRSLPKNIDLLRLCPPRNPNPNPKPEPVPVPRSDNITSSSFSFLPLPWSDSLLRAWSRWVLPQDFLQIDGEDADTADRQTLLFGNRLTSSGCENKRVSLLPIGISCSTSKGFRFSYVARIMESVCHLEENLRNQLWHLLETCCRQRRGIGTVYGFWMKPDEEASLFLVCESFERGLSDILNGDGKWAESFDFGMIGMELCEVVMNLHSKAIVIGCLGIGSFFFDEYGHCLLDFNTVLLQSKRILRKIKGGDTETANTQDFVSPKVFVSLHEGGGALNYYSDVWSLGCILAKILLGDAKLDVELFEGFCCLLPRRKSENFVQVVTVQYEVWKEKVISRLEALMSGTKSESLLHILGLCLNYEPKNRPQVRDIWCCIKSLFYNTPFDDVAALDVSLQQESDCVVNCLLLQDMYHNHKEASGVPEQDGNGCISEDISELALTGNGGSSMDHSQKGQVDVDLVNGLRSGGLKFDTLQGHRDCITGLAIGGGYLFSSSYDKTVNVWSLQDFSHVQSLSGHKHRIMAMVVVDEIQPLCISGDNGRSIIVWRIGTSSGQELLKEWYEHDSWCYSGVHALAVSGGYLYSGSGDKSIKVWSLQDYSLACTMTGHKSTVSCLVVGNGILYSGSWDGNIRLWCLNDHNLLSVLGDDSSGSSPILSLSLDRHLLVSAHENGSVKMWKNDSFVRSMKIQDGAIFALQIDTKWLFTGGWNKLVDIQEISENELQMDIRTVGSITCDSVITSILYWHEKLFVGLSSKEIKVYYYEN